MNISEPSEYRWCFAKLYPDKKIFTCVKVEKSSNWATMRNCIHEKIRTITSEKEEKVLKEYGIGFFKPQEITVLIDEDFWMFQRGNNTYYDMWFGDYCGNM